MIRSTKHIFTVAALALLCVPALHCENTQQQVLSKDTLKQSITQIPHIYNPDASVSKFKTDYAKFMQLEMTAKEKTDVCLELLTTAQEIKEQVQAKINDLESKKLDKRKLAKGIACITGSLIVLGILNHNFNPFPYNILSPETLMVAGCLGMVSGYLGKGILLCANSFNLYPDSNSYLGKSIFFCLKSFDGFSPVLHLRKCLDTLDEIIMHLQAHSYF